MKENVGQYIKRVIKQSGILGKLIAVSTVVFLAFVLMGLGERIFVGPPEVLPTGQVLPTFTEIFRNKYFSAPGDPSLLLYKPWSIITHMFTHGSFGHFLFNMIALYFSGRIFISFFGERRLLLTYFLGGFFAYVVHVLASNFLPGLSGQAIAGVVGASGAVMAIFVAAAVHRPSYPIHLFGVFKMPLFVLAALYLLSDLMGVGSNDQVAHFAHIGGALFGGLSVINAFSSKNIMNRIDRFIFKLKLGDFSFKRKKKKPKMKVYKAPKAATQTDDEYNADKAAHKARIDAILDKISTKGYEGLTKEEKDILFNESKR